MLRFKRHLSETARVISSDYFIHTHTHTHTHARARIRSIFCARFRLEMLHILHKNEKKLIMTEDDDDDDARLERVLFSSTKTSSSSLLPVASSRPEEDPNDAELYEIEGYPVDREPTSLDFAEKLLLIGRYEKSGAMAREIYAAHRKGEYTSAFPEREHGRDVQLVSMAVWMQAKFKTTTTTAGGGLKTIEEDVRMLCEDGCLEKEENKSAAAYDEVGIECNDKSERVVLANCPRIVRLLWAKLKWEEDPDMPSDLTLAEQSERRRKEYLDVGDPKTRRRKRREEQVREVERVLLKYVLSYDEEGRKVEFDEEEEEEEEEGEVEIYGGEREGKKTPVTDQASWLYAVEILARERNLPKCAQEWVNKRYKRGGCSQEAYECISRDIGDVIEPKIVHVRVSYNGGNVKTEQIVTRKSDGKKIMRRVQTDKKPEPRDVYYLDEDDEEKKEKIEMEMDRKTAGIKDVAEYEPHAQTASKPSQKDASSYSFYEMMKAEAKSSSAGFPIKIASGVVLLGLGYSILTETYRLFRRVGGKR